MYVGQCSHGQLAGDGPVSELGCEGQAAEQRFLRLLLRGKVFATPCVWNGLLVPAAKLPLVLLRAVLVRSVGIAGCTSDGLV